MFQLTAEELETLRFQIGTSKSGRGGRRYLPYAFTEQGVAMLASVLNSPRAVQVSIGIVRIFVKLRATLAAHKDMAQRLGELERKFEKHDAELHYVFEAIRELMAPEPVPLKRRIGFNADDE
jgi:ORF6N domain